MNEHRTLSRRKQRLYATACVRFAGIEDGRARAAIEAAEDLADSEQAQVQAQAQALEQVRARVDAAAKWAQSAARPTKCIRGAILACGRWPWRAECVVAPPLRILVFKHVVPHELTFAPTENVIGIARECYDSRFYNPRLNNLLYDVIEDECGTTVAKLSGPPSRGWWLTDAILGLK